MDLYEAVYKLGVDVVRYADCASCGGGISIPMGHRTAIVKKPEMPLLVINLPEERIDCQHCGVTNVVSPPDVRIEEEK